MLTVTVKTNFAHITFKGSADEIAEALTKLGINFDKVKYTVDIPKPKDIFIGKDKVKK